MARKTRDFSPAPTPRTANVAAVGAVLLTLVLIAAIVATIYFRRQSDHATGATASAPATSGLIGERGIVFGGLPRAGADLGPVTVLRNEAYLVGYSESRKDPLWVAYHVIHMDKPFHLERPRGNFLTDLRTQARVTHEDFTGSGFDRGHMAPNAAIAHCFGAAAQRETFLLSNICPQAGNLNEKVWAELERAELAYADAPGAPGDVYVLDGPVFPDISGGGTVRKTRTGIAIPTAFYKILIEAPSGRPRAFSVIMPQTVRGTELPGQFLTSIGEIEKETHLTFLPDLPAAEAATLKAKVAPMW
jgi:endonuclease G